MYTTNVRQHKNIKMRKLKKEIIDNVQYTYSTEWINKLESEEHWLLYRQQQSILSTIIQEGDSVLEIGPGTGFCCNYLRAKGAKVTTLDIDKDKNPNIHANIVTFTPEQHYDHILGFEVFEHIPYDKCIEVLKRLKGFCKNIVISIPFNEVRLIKAKFSLPILKNVSFSIFLPKFRITEANHFWEVNHGIHKEKRIIADFNSLGYKIISKKKYHSRLFLTLQNEGEQFNKIK